MNYTTLRQSSQPALKKKTASGSGVATLRLSTPGDIFEQEADRVAQEITKRKSTFGWSLSNINLGPNVPANCTGAQWCNCNKCAKTTEESNKEPNWTKLSHPDETGPRISRSPKQLQRKVNEAEVENPEQKDFTEEELVGDESGWPKRITAAPQDSAVVPWVRPSGQGEPLGLPVRDFMEKRFGYDFNKVRVHRSPEASQSASQLHAHAYTVGNDIYFNKGQFQPDSEDGKQLLAHELTHVVQQFTGDGGAHPLLLTRKKTGAHHGSSVPCGPSSCNGKCAKSVTGQMHSPICGNETCNGSGPSSSSNFIRHLDVNLSTQMVEAEMGDVTHAKSVVLPFLSSPNPSTTPKGLHKIGVKCTPCHTNQSGHGMGWFTSFKNVLEFGFHNSQPVAKGVRSLACVRVPCDRARWIHDNTSTGVTSVCVHSGGRGNDWGCDHPRPTLGGARGVMGDFPARTSPNDVEYA